MSPVVTIVLFSKNMIFLLDGLSAWQLDSMHRDVELNPRLGTGLVSNLTWGSIADL